MLIGEQILLKPTAFWMKQSALSENTCPVQALTTLTTRAQNSNIFRVKMCLTSSQKLGQCALSTGRQAETRA